MSFGASCAHGLCGKTSRESNNNSHTSIRTPAHDDKFNTYPRKHNLHYSSKTVNKMKPPKFYSNLPDNNHCLQASLMIVLNTLSCKTTWNEINKLTRYQDGLYSWSVTGVQVLVAKIPGTKLISSNLNYNRFAKEGNKYLKKTLSPEWYELQKRNASPNFSEEQETTKKITEKKLSKYKKLITMGNIKGYLKNNLIIALIDPHVITGILGSSGHFVVVYDHKNDNFLLHDPGLPQHENWQVNQKIFMKAFRGDIITVPKV